MRFTGVGGTLRRPWLGGMRGVMGVAALAAGLVLALTVMPACGSGCPTPEQAAYLNEAAEWGERTIAANEGLVTISLEAGNHPEALLDEGWRRRLKRVLDEMNFNHEAMIDLEVPAGVGEVHRAVLRAAQAYIEANELLWQGVLDVDAELIGKSNERRRESTRLVEEATVAVERLCE